MTGLGRSCIVVSKLKGKVAETEGAIACKSDIDCKNHKNKKCLNPPKLMKCRPFGVVQGVKACYRFGGKSCFVSKPDTVRAQVDKIRVGCESNSDCENFSENECLY